MYLKLTDKARSLGTQFYCNISQTKILGNAVVEVKEETRIIKDYMGGTITVATKDEYDAYLASKETKKTAPAPASEPEKTPAEPATDPAPATSTKKKGLPISE